MGIATESIYENSGGLTSGAVTWVDMQNYRDPPPYPGHSKQVFTNQPGFRQSFSGSETSTDVSLSSTENLATSQRQEPQGEETQASFYHHHHQHHQQQYHYQHHQLDLTGSGDVGSSYSILARLGMPPGGLEAAGKPYTTLQQQQQSPHPLVSASASSSLPPSQGDKFTGHYHQFQQYSYTGSTGTGSSGGGLLTSTSSTHPAMTAADPIYSHGHLTVPQWHLKADSRAGGSIHKQGMYSPQQQQQQPAAHPPAAPSPRPDMSVSPSPPSPLPAHAGLKKAGSSGFSLCAMGPSASDFSTSVASSSSSSSCSLSSYSSSSSSSSKPVNTTCVSTPLPASRRMADYASQPCQSHPYLSPRVPPVSTHHHPHPYVNAHFSLGSEDSTSSAHSQSSTAHAACQDSGSSSRSSSDVRASGLQQQQQQQQRAHHHLSPSPSPSQLPPPPDYPGPWGGKRLQVHDPRAGPAEKAAGDIRACRSYETMDKVDKLTGSTLSQPDVRLCASSPGIYLPDPKRHGHSPARSTNTSSDESEPACGSHQAASVAAKASRMVDVLTEENRALREELANATVKVSRLLKFELEVQKMHEAHQSLLQSHQKRETLWLAMRRKMEERCLALEAAALADATATAVAAAGSRTDAADPGKPASASDVELRSKLAEKEALIARLLAQNQELVSSRKQLEAENLHLSVSLAEQKAHVGIVEKALVNTQARVLLLDEECQKMSCVDPGDQLQTLQDADTDQGAEPSKKREAEDSRSVALLKKMILDKDAHIVQLEKDVTLMKQNYMTGAALRMDEASQPLKEVRLAALEKSSSDMEKLIDEAKTEKLRHMEELHEGNKKVAELEARVKQLQTQLVEKEAMLKVIHRAPLLPRSSSLHALCHSPLHSPRPSLIASQALEGTSPSFLSTGTHREFASIRHMKTGSTSAIDLGRKLSMEEDLLTKVQNLNVEDKEDSGEEVKLWHV